MHDFSCLYISLFSQFSIIHIFNLVIIKRMKITTDFFFNHCVSGPVLSALQIILIWPCDVDTKEAPILMMKQMKQR